MTVDQEAHAPVLDYTVFSTIEAMMGREKFKQALAKFQAELRQRVEAICGADAGPDDIRADAHKIVGTAGMMGFRQLSHCASVLEDAVCRGSSELSPLVDEVRSAADRALAEIEAQCSS